MPSITVSMLCWILFVLHAVAKIVLVISILPERHALQLLRHQLLYTILHNSTICYFFKLMD
jgi:hypothetical protein